ncbi:BON domain-containing protein [Actinoplanes sp. NPDC049681]|uniref:BON domain-containing protein n=1 Tax=Actinoplanes sp. NPDC049681 TaxID=3363905 RepID=UPI0037B9FDF0
MDGEGVKRLPVINDLGRPVGILARGDLLKVHLRPDDDIRGDVMDAIVDVIGAQASGELTVDVRDGVVTLGGRTDRWSTADIAARLTRLIAGVAEVVDDVSWDHDDRGAP